ncbi:hypothetical protein QA584_02735 [Anaerocolumna sp. AGMB13025]|uniref:hypothetical protein n=1 Tax=Anaerocolumna sp. AGMB13025 TaxID=3039116 RepID=UPI00241D6335|nr:hypothetical protein [Anaerocolumna sp. AGMB13025]WFR57997.1 hypothetical protein QA584_02735 [Anaerocolumna sp. AGMB13025]
MVEKDQLKDSVLDDSAEIYKPRKEQTEKQKLSEMTWKEKITYFNNYYRVATIVIIAVIAAVIYLIYNIVTPKPEPVLYAAVINSAIDTETAQNLQTDFGNKLGIDPKTQEIMIDTSFFLGSDSNVSEYSMSVQQKLSTYFFAGQIDVLIAPESFFANYAHLGNLSKLTDELPTELCTKLANSFYNSDTEDDPATSPYGIYLDGAKIYDNNGTLIDRPVLGIVVNSKYKQNAVEFIKYLFDLK